MKTPNHYGLEFHHLGLAVKQPELAVKFLTGLGYTIGDPVRDDRQNVNLIFCPAPAMPAVEIIFPTETPGPLTPLLKSKATLIYHICYEAQNREQSLRALEADRHHVSELSPPQPAVLFGGRVVSFYVVAGFGVIELLEPE